MMKEYRDFAVRTALEAGQLLIDNYGKMHELDWHMRTNFKIEVDKKNDELIRRRIKERFPEHNIYSEENERLDRNSELSWVFDPLDGTIPYTYGITDHFSVAISLVRGRTPIVGVIYAPKREELYVGVEGEGAFCNNKRINVSLEDNINKVVMGLDNGKETEEFKRNSIAHYEEKLLSVNGVTTTLSSACATVPLCLVASGKMHAYVALSLEPWDMSAAVVINREAGAKVTNLNDGYWKLGDCSIVSANPKLHSKLINLMRD